MQVVTYAFFCLFVFFVALEPVLELALVDQAVLELALVDQAGLVYFYC